MTALLGSQTGDDVRRVCLYCGGPVTGRMSKKYCSLNCQDKAKKMRRYYSDPDYRARSIAKSRLRQYKLGIGSISDPRPQTCCQCGCVYTPKKNHPENRFCSKTCQDKFNNRTRRLRLVLALRVPYRDIDILERDGWRCKLCGKKINPRLKGPHPMAASIDHIVPLALGGNDCPENVQAAHLSCNSAKHTRAMNEQLMLVG